MMIIAEFRESIRLVIPQIVPLLEDSKWYVRRAGAQALSKLSEQGKISAILIWHD